MLTDSNKQAEICGQNMTRGKAVLPHQRGHLHILKLEVVLKCVGSDELQLTRCDRAGAVKKEDVKTRSVKTHKQ